MHSAPTPPKMSRKQAKLLWKNLSPQQRIDFNKMYAQLCGQELLLSHVNVTTDEKIVNIVLDQKNKPSKSTEPFAKHFKIDP
jgi:hypothetical protein